MSGAEIALVVVGAVASVALLAAGVLLVQVRRLRGELRASAAMAPGARAEVQPGPLARRDADPVPPLRLPMAPPAAPVTQQQVVVATVGHPLVRAASLAHGLRQALAPENRDRIRALVRRDLHRREKLRRRAARRAARVLPTAPPPAADAVGDRRDVAS